MFEKTKKFINQPYPFDYDFEKVVKAAAGCGLFIFLFLYIFNPFDKQNEILPYFDIIVLVGYGLITFLILFFAGLIFITFIPSVFNEENWKVKNEIIASTLILILIGLANAFYNGMIDTKSLSLQLFFDFQLYTFGIGIFPTFFFAIMEQHWLLKKNFMEAQQINANLQISQTHFQDDVRADNTIVLTSDNEKENLELKYKDLLFIKSVGNYIEVYFKKGGIIDTHILRSSLKRVETSLVNNNSICRSHRAYLVNLKNISSVSGNSQGYQLEFDETDKTVPVSRKYLKNIRDLILQ
ncbi:MAG: LytTR family transcriptional regulator [Calditrichaceae bacterium]|nr:LytTR family transcriptional regulator [Calditrichaceae bacterium]